MTGDDEDQVDEDLVDDVDEDQDHAGDDVEFAVDEHIDELTAALEAELGVLVDLSKRQGQGDRSVSQAVNDQRLRVNHLSSQLEVFWKARFSLLMVKSLGAWFALQRKASEQADADGGDGPGPGGYQ